MSDWQDFVKRTSPDFSPAAPVAGAPAPAGSWSEFVQHTSPPTPSVTDSLAKEMRQALLGAVGGPSYKQFSPEWWLHRADIAVHGQDAVNDIISEWQGRDQLLAKLQQSAAPNGQVATPDAIAHIRSQVTHALGDSEGTAERLKAAGMEFNPAQYYEGGGLTEGAHGVFEAVHQLDRYAGLGGAAINDWAAGSGSRYFDAYKAGMVSQENRKTADAGQRAAATMHDLADIGSYLIPGFGQAKIATDLAGQTSNVLTRAESTGLLPAIGQEIWKQAEGLAPWAPDILPEERVTRTLAAALMALGAKHGVEKMRSAFETLKMATASADIPTARAAAQAVEAIKANPATEFLATGEKPGGAYYKAKADPEVAANLISDAARQGVEAVPGDGTSILDTPHETVTPTPDVALQTPKLNSEEIIAKLKENAASAEQRLAEQGIGTKLDADAEQLHVRQAMGENAPPTEPKYRPVSSRDDLYYSLMDKFDLSKEEAQASADLFDAHAEVYAENQGISKREAYEQLLAGVGRSGEKVPVSMVPEAMPEMSKEPTPIRWRDDAEGIMEGRAVGVHRGRIIAEVDGANGPFRLSVEPVDVLDGIPGERLKDLQAIREREKAAPFESDLNTVQKAGQGESLVQPIPTAAEGTVPRPMAENAAAGITVRTEAMSNPKVTAGYTPEGKAAAAIADKLMAEAVPVKKNQAGTEFKFLAAMEHEGEAIPVELTVTKTPGEDGTYDLAHVQPGPSAGPIGDVAVEGAGIRAADLVRGADGEGVRLWQQARAEVTFVRDGRALVSALKAPDASSFVHEMGHILRRSMYRMKDFLSTEELRAVEEWAGAQMGRWGREAEERFARAFEKYLADGKSPTRRLEGVFAKFKSWLTKIYQKVTNTPLADEVSPDVQAVFDRLVGKDIEGRMDAQAKAEAEIQRAVDQRDFQLATRRRELLNIDPDDPRLDPYASEAEGGDPMLQDEIRQLLGMGDSDKRTPGEILTDAGHAYEMSQDSMIEASVEQLKEDLDYIGKSQSKTKRQGKQTKEGATEEGDATTQQKLRGKGREYSEHSYNMWVKKGQGWFRSGAIRLIGGFEHFPDLLAKELFDYARNASDGEYRIAPKNTEWANGASRPPKDSFTPSEAAEMDGSEYGDGTVHKGFRVPAPIYDSFRKMKLQQLAEAMKGDPRFDIKTDPALAELDTLQQPSKSIFAGDDGQKKLNDMAAWGLANLEQYRGQRHILESALQRKFGLQQPQAARVATATFQLQAAPRILEVLLDTASTREVRKMLDAEHSGISKSGQADAIKLATESAGLGSPKDVVDRLKAEKVDDAKTRATQQIIDTIKESGSTAKVREMLAAEYPEIPKKQHGATIDATLKAAGLPTPDELKSQWRKFDFETFQSVLDDMASVSAAKLHEFASSRDAHQWIKGNFGLSAKEATAVLGRAQESLAAERIGQVYEETGSLRKIREMLAEEFKAIPKNRYPDVIQKGLDLSGNPVARAVKVETTPEGERVEVPGKMVVAGQTLTVPERLVATLKDWSGRIPKATFLWDESRFIERLSERDPAIYDWLVGHRERAVTSLRLELAGLKKETKTMMGSLEKDTGARAALQKYAEGRVTNETNETRPYTLDDLKEERPGDWQRIEAVEPWFRQKYDNLLERANAVREEFGQEPIPRRKDYFTHIADVADTWDLLLNASDLEVHSKAFEGSGKTGFSFNTKRNMPGNPFAKERTGIRTRYDALENFDTYLKPILGEIHLTEAAVRRRALARVMETNEAAGDLTSAAKYLHDMADELTGQKHILDKAIDNWLFRNDVARKGVKAYERILSRTASNKVGGTLSVAISQTIPLAVTPAYAGFDNLARATFSRVLQALTGIPEPWERSAFLTRRMADARPLGEGTMGKVTDVANKPFELIEHSTNKLIWESFQIQASRAGKTIAEADAYADKMLQRLVPGRLVGEMTPAFRSRAGRTLFQFQYEVNNFMLSLRHDINWSELEGRKLTKAETFKRAATMWTTLYVFAQAQKALTGNSSAPDAIGAAVDAGKNLTRDDLPDWAKGVKAIGRVGGEVAGLLPGGNELTSLLVRDPDLRQFVFGDSQAAKFSGTAPLADTIVQTGTPLIKGDIAGFTYRLLTDVAMPFGGAQLRKTVGGIRAVSEGGVEGKDGKMKYEVQGPEAGKAVIFGAGSTSEARQFYDSISQKLDERVAKVKTDKKGEHRHRY